MALVTQTVESFFVGSSPPNSIPALNDELSAHNETLYGSKLGKKPSKLTMCIIQGVAISPILKFQWFIIKCSKVFVQIPPFYPQDKMDDVKRLISFCFFHRIFFESNLSDEKIKKKRLFPDSFLFPNDLNSRVEIV